MPVITIARFSTLQNSILSLSRIEPPGWMKLEMPSAAAMRTQSSNGKNASEARLASFRLNLN
jgi:hypothetical protein